MEIPGRNGLDEQSQTDGRSHEAAQRETEPHVGRITVGAFGTGYNAGVKRRIFLTGLSGWAIAGLSGARETAPKRVVVIGGGIVGAGIAYRLARRGVEVTVLERDRPAAGATGQSFAWLNAHYSKQPFHYHELNRLGISAWHALEHEAGGAVDIQWSGAVEWYPQGSNAEEMIRLIPRLQAWGHPVRPIAAEEIRRLEPGVVSGPVGAAAFAECDGMLDPVRAASWLLEAARKAGAHIVYPSRVTGFQVRERRVRAVLTAGDDIATDAVVIAAGVDAADLCAELGSRIRLVPAPGLLVHTAPLPRLVSRVVVAEKAHLKQYADGRVVLGDDFGPPKTADHAQLTGARDFPSDEIRRIHAQRLVRQAREYLPGVSEASIERLSLGWRPMPADGLPVIGFLGSCPNAYVAVTHSGVTLAALLGQLVSVEMLDGVRVERLDAYRPARFA